MTYSKYDKVRFSQGLLYALSMGIFTPEFAEWADGHRETVFTIWGLDEEGQYIIDSPIAHVNNWTFKHTDLRLADTKESILPEDLFTL
jgi:hypothetical protein